MHTLKRGSKTVGFYYQDKPYVIGFTKLIHARAVHYSIHPEPRIRLFKNEQYIKENNVIMYPSSMLLIPKCQGSVLDPMNDGGFHLSVMNKDTFNLLPIMTRLNIIYAYDLVNEDAEDFVFRTHVICNDS